MEPNYCEHHGTICENIIWSPFFKKWLCYSCLKVLSERESERTPAAGLPGAGPALSRAPLAAASWRFG